MKRAALFLILICTLSFNAKAVLYHGIDIDDIFSKSDWSSKQEIIDITNDYSRLLQYQNELDNCSKEKQKIFSCYDNLAEKILTTMYIYPEISIKEYRQFRKSLSEVYAIQACTNKYLWPSGNLCELDSRPATLKVLHDYIQGLIDSSKEKMISYLPELQHYK